MNPDLSGLPKIQASELTFRWVDGYYDGVLSGFAEFRGNLCYFECCGAHWKYLVYELSRDESVISVQEYEEWKALYGDHFDLLSDGSDAGGASRSTLEQGAAAGDAMARGEWEPPKSYRGNPIVGWFEAELLGR